MQRRVWNELVESEAPMSGSFVGPRLALMVSVFTTRRSSAQWSNTLMRVLRTWPSRD
jgi:hypothetical protein